MRPIGQDSSPIQGGRMIASADKLKKMSNLLVLRYKSRAAND